MNHIQQMQERAIRKYKRNYVIKDADGGEFVGQFPFGKPSLPEFIEGLIAEVVKETKEGVAKDLKEVYLGDDGEDNYIALTARIVEFYKTLTPPDTEELSTNTKEV